MSGIFKVVRYFFFYSLIYFLFSIIYIYIIVPYFSYEGYYIDISKEKIALSILFLSLFSLILEKKEKVSVSLLNALIGFSIIPMLVLFSLQNLSLEYMVYTVINVILISLVIRIKFKFKFIPLNYKYVFIITFIFSLFIIFFLFWKNHSYFNLDITKVYEYRRIISDNTPNIIEYMYNILFKGLIPLLFLYSLFYLQNKFKKILFTIFLLSIYIFLFGVTSHKFFLFIIPFIIFLYLISMPIKNWSMFFIKFLIFLLSTFIIIYTIFKNSEITLLASSLFLRRIFFVPATLNFSYFEFFKEHNLVYFTDSKFLPFGYILDYPYDLNISHLIGREMFGKPEMGANTGWLGSGYAQAGFLGMFLYAFIISLILKYLDFVSKYLKREFIILSFIPYIITLFLSSDLKTILLTHGLIFYLILIGILAHNEKIRRMKFAYKIENLPHLNSSSNI